MIDLISRYAVEILAALGLGLAALFTRWELRKDAREDMAREAMQRAQARREAARKAGRDVGEDIDSLTDDELVDWLRKRGIGTSDR